MLFAIDSQICSSFIICCIPPTGKSVQWLQLPASVLSPSRDGLYWIANLSELIFFQYQNAKQNKIQHPQQRKQLVTIITRNITVYIPVEVELGWLEPAIVVFEFGVMLVGVFPLLVEATGVAGVAVELKIKDKAFIYI